jgi:hypothetical protein
MLLSVYNKKGNSVMTEFPPIHTNNQSNIYYGYNIFRIYLLYPLILNNIGNRT